MSTTNILRQKKVVHLLAIALLLLGNLMFVELFSLEVSRAVRLTSIAMIFSYFIFKQGSKNQWIVFLLGIFLTRDVFFQFYELSWGYKGYLLFGILAYGTIIMERLPSLENIHIKWDVVFIALLLIAANSYTMYVLMDMLSMKFNDAVEVWLFYCYGAMMMTMGVAAITYNNKYNSTRSLFFVFFTFGFILSDIASLFAYYFGFELFFHVDRALIIAAFCLLADYGLNEESVREEFYQYHAIDKSL